MKRFSRSTSTRFIAIMFSVFLYSEYTHSQDIKYKLDEYMTVLTEQEKFSGSVLIAKDKEILLSKGYGMANYELDVPNSPLSKFRLASVSKQFTAMAIMLLKEQGLLNVDDRLSKYIPDYPNGDSITVHHLLTHSSGIVDIADLKNFKEELVKKHSILETIDLFKHQALEFTPGEKYKYSNSGYILLSYLIEKVSNQTFEEFLIANIFTPLNMLNSGYDDNYLIIKNRTSGYEFKDNKLHNSDYINISFPSGAGALYSSVEDLYLWDQALHGGSIFSKEIISTIFSPYIQMDSQRSYGYGWLIRKINDRTIVEHNGGVEGFSTNILRYTKDKVSIIMLGNIEGIDVNRISKNLAAIVFSEPYQLPTKRVSITINPSIYDQYRGNYKSKDNNILSITNEKNRLFIKQAGQKKIEFFPESEGQFFHKMIDVQIIFTKCGLILRDQQEDRAYEKIG